MKCMNCPIVAEVKLFVFTNGDEVDLYECPFGTRALHLGDHRCCKLNQRKEAVALLEINQNEEENNG